jgi:hypothetical protein
VGEEKERRRECGWSKMGGRTVSKRASGQMVTTGARASTCVLWLAVLLCVAAGPSASAQAHTGARQRGMASGRGDSSSIAVHHDTLSEKNQMQQKTNVLHVAHQQLDEGGDNGAADDAGVKTASKEARLDPANFVVVIIASLLLIYCSHRALHPPFLDVQKMSSREREEMRELEEAGEMPLLSAFLFVFVASLALLLIFYFMSAMSLLITILFSFIATISLGAALYPYADNLTGNKFSHDTDLPLIGPVPTLAFLLAPVCILTVALWLFTKNWLLNNILAISLIVFFLTTIRISNLMVNTVLLVLAFFYDIFWVFCSSAVFGSNVRVAPLLYPRPPPARPLRDCESPSHNLVDRLAPSF